MKLRLFVLTLLVILISSHILYAQQKDEGKNFVDPQKRYTINLLPGWQEYTEEGETIFTSSKSEKDIATCYVFGFPVEQGMTLQEMSSWMLEGFKDGGEGYEFKLRGQEKTRIAGVDALLIKQEEKYKEKDFEQTIYIDEYFLIKNNQGVILHFDTTKESYENFKSDFQKMASRFELGDKQFESIINEGVTPSPDKTSKEPTKTN